MTMADIPKFDIWIDTEATPGSAQIDIWEDGTPDAGKPGGTVTLASQTVPDRGDIPFPHGRGILRYSTASGPSMAHFAQLPDWVRNDTLDTLARAYIALQDAGHDFTTH